MCIFIIIPLILVIYFAFTNKSWQFTLENFTTMREYVPVFLRSVFLALISTVICLILGFPMAYIITKFKRITQSTLTLMLMLPMWMNFLLRTYAWLSIIENTGLINRFLSLLNLPNINIINTQGAVVLGMVYNYLPFMIIPIYNVLNKIDKSVFEAAEDLGANKKHVFTKIILPLSFPGIMSGITMVFVPAISTFIISKLLGGGKSILIGDLIDMQFLGNSYNPHLGSALSLVLMVFILISLGIMSHFDKDNKEGMI